MQTIKNSLINCFTKIALNEISKHHGSNVCCILYHGSDILSIECNSVEMVRYIGPFKYICPSVHAEVNAISKLVRPGIKKRIKVNLFVLRASTTGNIGNAIPCKHCLEFLKSDIITKLFNISKITYSINNTTCKTQKIDDITTEHISRGWKHFKLHG